jgi:hypothetical protein
MKATHLHVLAVSVVVVGGLYAAFTDLTPQPREPAPAGTVARRPQASPPGGEPLVERSSQGGKETEEGAVTKLAEELSRLRTEVARLRDHVQQLAATAATAAVSSEEDAGGQEPPRTAEDMERLTQAQAYEDRQRQATTDAQFHAEGVDRQWAATTTDLLTQTLEREDLAGTEAVDTDCRRSTCRLTLSHDDEAAASQFDLIFPMQVAEALPQATSFRQLLADGRIATVLYLVRQRLRVSRCASGERTGNPGRPPDASPSIQPVARGVPLDNTDVSLPGSHPGR